VISPNFDWTPGTTFCRYVGEAANVLPEQAPGLPEALERAMADGVPYGQVFVTGRSREPRTSVKGEQIDAWYSGKARGQGGNAQALPALYRAAAPGMPTLADSGYEGAGTGILVPVKNPAASQELDIDARTRNAHLSDLRCRGERGFAPLTQRWATLQHITAATDRTTEITCAALALTEFEHRHIR
jgi:hypothetical protein